MAKFFVVEKPGADRPWHIRSRAKGASHFVSAWKDVVKATVACAAMNRSWQRTERELRAVRSKGDGEVR